jgi:hypothetical protein
LSNVHFELHDFCNMWTKTWAASPVRCAAMLQMLAGRDRTYVKMSYHALNNMEFDSMSPVVKALFRQQLQHGRMHPNEMFARCMKALDPRNAELKTVVVKDVSTALGIAREIIKTEVLGQDGFSPSRATASVKKLAALRANKIAA